jgi:hypothetical protein
METLSSSEFRKVYAKLSEPTLVVVNGHRIGLWTPSTSREEFSRMLRGEGGIREMRIPMDLDPTLDDGPWNSSSRRPFTPVPKPSKRK